MSNYVWRLPGDGSDAPEPVAIGIGAADAIATEVVTGALQEGQQVIVGTAAAARGGPALLGILGL